MLGLNGLKRLVRLPRSHIRIALANLAVAYEKRTLTLANHPTSQRKPPLEFPALSRHALTQPSWQSQDLSGRINIVLSEQLICRNNGGSQEPDLGVTNDLVCFSFQHAPKGMMCLSEVLYRLIQDRCTGASWYLMANPQPTVSARYPKRQLHISRFD
jgi:hypothetical protein